MTPPPGGLPESLLLLTDRYPPHPGGLARSSQRLARHAVDLGIRTHVLVPRCDLPPGAVQSAREEPGGIWVHRTGTTGSAEQGPQLALLIESLHRREGFALFHGQYGSTAGFAAVWSGVLLDVPAYVSLRGNDLDRDVHDPGRFPHLRFALERAAEVGAVSPPLQRAAEALRGAPVRYTPNSVDAETFRPLPPDPALRERVGLGTGPVLGFAGELRHKKGAPFLFAALHEVPEARLLLVGTARPSEERALAELQEALPELGERIRRVPYVQDPAELAALYAMMDVVVSPSLWEGMPNAVLEALACGRPVLASDAGGIPELVRHGETGWLLPRTELNRLGEALREVLALEPEEREAVGAAGREWVRTEFPLRREREELAAAYRAAAARADSTA